MRLKRKFGLRKRVNHKTGFWLIARKIELCNGLRMLLMATLTVQLVD
jgi:hypothetical protein